MAIPTGLLKRANVVPPVLPEAEEDPAKALTFVYVPTGTDPPTFVGDMAVMSMFLASI
jgi:hypothetical protein